MEIPDGKKRWGRILLVATAWFVILGAVSFADDRVTLRGRVTDAGGKPIEHATVMVYHAGVKKGYSTFCPSCYADCGKRAITDDQGMFTFSSLSSDLWFELLAVGEGWEPTFVYKVDPSSGVPVVATLAHRQSVNDPDRVFRGRVEDSQGAAIRDAVVQPVGALSNTGVSRYGTIRGLELLAISNPKGQFEIASSQPESEILVSIEARGMAQMFAVIPAGVEYHKTTITEGATIRGRLVQDGKPVGGAEVGLMGSPRGWHDNKLAPSAYPYEEIRIGTQPDGTFIITNVPAPVDCYIYGKMESLARRGATGVIECATKHDKEMVDVGDIQVKPAYHLRGRVVLSDGKPIPDGMRVNIHSEHTLDGQTAMLPPDGHFEFVGLASGSYSIYASVKGYDVPSKGPTSVSVKNPDGTITTTTYRRGIQPPISIERDMEGFVITLHPKNEARPTGNEPTPRKSPQL